jgi:hypothetical protein
MPPMTTTPTATVDGHGNPVSGDRAAVDRYDEALDRLLRLDPAVVRQANALVREVPDFAMGQALRAYLSLSSTDARDLAGARRAASAMDVAGGGERERAHRGAIGAWLAGDWHGAARRLDDLLLRWPADLLALQVGHQLDFFLGDAANLRDRVGRVLGRLDPGDPHHGFVRGMYAFGLEESGHYDLAEAHGTAAVEADPGDVWAIHALAHVHEMRGDVDRGIRFLAERPADWGDGSLFAVHTWWHLALFLLEAGMPGAALSVYDTRIGADPAAGIALDMVDAASLLWRLALDGVDTGDRFGPLAEAWADRTAAAEPWYAFNDLHAVMALCGAGRPDDARDVIGRLERYVAAPGAAAAATNVATTAAVGLAGCRAMLAYAEGRDDDVLAVLVPIRARLGPLGGSHAQRDVLHRTIVESALRAGETALADALLSERLALRPASVHARTRWAGLARRTGLDGEARRREAEADRHRARFAAAAEDARPLLG